MDAKCRSARLPAWILLLAVVLLAVASTAASAAESVRVVVEGLSGKELANVEAALAVPPALIREGRVDRLWLERFERQAPGKTREALEAFGYYKPVIATRMDNPGEGVYRLTVRVDPGEPVRLTAVRVKVQGAGTVSSMIGTTGSYL